MTDHRISVSTIGQASGFVVRCSCGEDLLTENLADLADLIDLARKHVESKFPIMMIEAMNAPLKIKASDLGFTDEDLLHRYGGKA